MVEGKEIGRGHIRDKDYVKNENNVKEVIEWLLKLGNEGRTFWEDDIREAELMQRPPPNHWELFTILTMKAELQEQWGEKPG